MVRAFTDTYEGDDVRVTIAFDIITQTVYDEDIFDNMKDHGYSYEYRTDRRTINWVTRDTPIMFDVTVTTPPKDLIRQRAQDNFNRGKPNSLDKDYYLSDECSL